MEPLCILANKKKPFILSLKKQIENKNDIDINIDDKNDIIYSIHEHVLKELDNKKYDEILNILNISLTNCKTITCYNNVSSEISNYESKIKMNDNLKNRYLEKANPLLYDYREFYKKPINLNDQEKNKFHYNFYKIANLFVKTPYIKPNILKKKCINCNNDYNNFEHKKHSYVCKICGLEEICLINTLDFSEDKIEKDKDKETFSKALIKFQGKCNEDIPSSILQNLNNYCALYNIDIKTVKKQDMYSMLQELGYPNYYEDINLILWKFNKTPLPDLSRYEEQLKTNYITGENIYEKIKIDRKSSLNIQYLLFKHLELLEYPCTKEDFKIIETREILIGYDHIWKQICEPNNWKFIPTI